MLFQLFYKFHVNVKIVQTHSISPNTSNAVFKSFSSISSSRFPQYIDTLAKTKIIQKLEINFLKAPCFDKTLSGFCFFVFYYYHLKQIHLKHSQKILKIFFQRY